MNANKEIEIVYLHNKWRRSGEGEMENPTELGKAIDEVLRLAEIGNKTTRLIEAINNEINREVG